MLTLTSSAEYDDTVLWITRDVWASGDLNNTGRGGTCYCFDVDAAGPSSSSSSFCFPTPLPLLLLRLLLHPVPILLRFSFPRI